ncbi:SMI1/KNR4 family protein [Streptomyces sp. NPDC020875]|uniref:SMI1/KNR4 family protein n=1 Tax=Streptomyces sp. NPDC020875 TaxID=3154898 RepID=UPI0033EB5E3C
MDIVVEMRAAVAERRAAWEFVRSFVRAWCAVPLADGDGYGPDEIAAAERRLGLTLPAALREAYALLGLRPDLTSNQDVLRPLAELAVEPGEEADGPGAVLVFRDENQGVCRWGIPLAELGRDDPPVVVRADLADKSAERWEPWLERVSHCFVEIVLAEAVHEPEELAAYSDEVDRETLVATEWLVRLPFPEYPVGAPTGTRWYAGRDALLRDDDGMVSVRARGTEEELDRVLDDLLGPEPVGTPDGSSV